MKINVILQARHNSKRLPGKMILKFKNLKIIEYLIKNLKKIDTINKICLAVPDDKFSEIFYEIAKKNRIKFYVAKNIKENDLLSRFYHCAKKNKFKDIMRITPDCPFINIHMIDFMIKNFQKKKLFYLTNNKPKRFVPHGFDCEIFRFSLLEKAFQKAKTSHDQSKNSAFARHLRKEPGVDKDLAVADRRKKGIKLAKNRAIRRLRGEIK